jgi:hypothetical protein
MRRAVYCMLAIGTFLLASPFLAVQAADADEMVVNPMHKFWANFKPGSTATLAEKTILSGAEKNTFPDGIDEKDVTSKLLSVKGDNVVVQVVVAERDFLGTIETAPTKKTFPAKIKKAFLQAAMHNVDATRGEDTIEVLGQKLECKTVSGTEKKEGTEVEHKIWLSEKIPGGVVKHTRITRQDGRVIADTTIVLKAFKVAD